MSKSLNLASFAVGALIGSAVSWLVLKNKYEKIAQEEINSVKEAFSEKMKKCTDDHNDDGHIEEEVVKEESTDEKEVEIKEYNKILETTGYNGEEVPEPAYQSIISPMELGDIEWYKVVGLTYYADRVLADEEGNIVDVDETIGSYALSMFGEYDDDAVHVRNTKLETDYEVLLDERDYSEVFK